MKGFLDLPAELRNRIYDLALIHNRSDDRVANTALLRVCKKINNEAQALFQQSSVFCLLVVSTDLDAPMIIGGDIHTYITESVNPVTRALFPAGLLKVPTIKLDIHVPADPYIHGCSYERATRFATRLAEFLDGAKVRQEIRIKLERNAEPPTDNRCFFITCMWMLQSFLALKKMADIKLVGFGDEVEHWFWSYNNPVYM